MFRVSTQVVAYFYGLWFQWQPNFRHLLPQKTTMVQFLPLTVPHPTFSHHLQTTRFWFLDYKRLASTTIQENLTVNTAIKKEVKMTCNPTSWKLSTVNFLVLF